MPATRSRMPRERAKKQRRHSRTAGAGLNGDEHAHDSRARTIARLAPGLSQTRNV